MYNVDSILVYAYVVHWVQAIYYDNTKESIVANFTKRQLLTLSLSLSLSLFALSKVVGVEINRLEVEK